MARWRSTLALAAITAAASWTTGPPWRGTEQRTLRANRELRDCPIKVTEGAWTGYGIMEAIIHGEHPGFGLIAATLVCPSTV